MWATVAVLLLQPVLLLCSRVPAAQPPPGPSSPTVREYFIAAVEIGWDYIHMEEEAASEQRRRSKEIPQKYIKAVYREYVDSTYTVPRPRSPWTGIQGPVIVAKAGDRVVVHFKNLASQPYSISPVGITYWKQSEGAGYDDSTAGQEKADDAVFPGGYYEYVWDISYNDGPTADDPECLTYSYSSQVDTVRDINSGLIGALLICKPSAFTDDGQRKKTAFILLFAVFDETKSWYGEVGERRSREKFKRSNRRKEYHTINGYINSTLPGLKMCQSKKHVFWHLIGVGTAPGIHSIQFQDHSLEVLTHRKVTMEVTPMTFISAEMRPATLGQFLISCQIPSHRHDGMSALFTVEKCPEPAPGPDPRKVKPEEIEGEDDDDYFLFNTISYLPKKPSVKPRSSSGQNIWKHYIAIEEITWNYSPRLKPTDSEFQSPYLPAAPHHLGYKYKKAVYVEYTDSTFTQKKDPANTLLGPPLKGRVNDQIHITLKNKASRPFNIYPNGLTKIVPLQRPMNEEKDLRSIGVPPNRTFGYVWKLTADDGPLNGDAQCLTQVYQSTVSADRDLASGLVGTLLICKDDAIDTRGRLRGPDKEWRLVFAVFDENRSWYMDENMQSSSQSNANTSDPDFYNSNVIYSINGIMFSGRQFVICKTDVIFWHVASVGTQSDFLSVYFTGNLFQNQDLHHSVLTLFPMTGVTISMEPELIGEWEIGAFDNSLRSRGMSIYYTVRPCNDGELSLVDHDWENEDISDYIDQLDLQPRGRGPQNRTMLVRVCKKPLADDDTQLSGEHVPDNETRPAGQPRCQLKRVRVTSMDGGEQAQGSDEGIPQSILDDLESDGKWLDSQSGAEPGAEQSARQRRHAEGNGTDEEISSGVLEDGEISTEGGKQAVENVTGEKNETWSQNNATTGEPEDSSEMSADDQAMLSEKSLTRQQNKSTDVEPDYAQSPPERLRTELIDMDYNDTTDIDLSSMYDDYGQDGPFSVNGTSGLFPEGFINPRSMKVETSHYYYIAAEEITWDYGIRKPHQLISLREVRRGMRKFLPRYKKVVFRAYKDGNFIQPAGRGELHEHLGIMGPLISTEVNEQLTVVFKNKASRPYSFHLQGVYDRSQGAGTGHSSDSSAPPGVPGEPVAPGEARTYTWRVSRTQGPSDTEFACKTGAYYSTVDKERDIHSGLIGPLVICKPGTLQKPQYTQPGVQELALLFHTFDETKSWYLQENLQQYCAPPCQVNTEDPWYHDSNKFAAINGYVAETLPGLLVAQYQRVRWHLLNVGSDGEYHAVHFHGLPFTIHTKEEHRMGIYSLFPGVFGTVEMKPHTAGTWLVECTIGDYQLAGMRAKLLVYDPRCEFPLGMKSGRIEDFQITASDHINGWQPWLARLDQSGYINAWMGTNRRSWLQVDLLRPMLLHGVKTQGVRAKLRDHCITAFTISYSLDQETWVTYRGDNSIRSKFQEPLFYGNMDSSRVKHNHFVVPFVARYVRIHPMHYKLRPALRMELLGCDVNSCSHPLEVKPESFNASSSYSSLMRHWLPGLARLNQEGSVNAWRPESNNPHEWLQVDLGKVKRITGLVTQGARSFVTPMMVTEFSVTFSRDKHSWSSVTEEESQREKTFTGNNTPEEEAMSVFEPALFARYLRIHPRGWINDIALRVEVLGCDTQPEL